MGTSCKLAPARALFGHEIDHATPENVYLDYLKKDVEKGPREKNRAILKEINDKKKK